MRLQGISRKGFVLLTIVAIGLAAACAPPTPVSQDKSTVAILAPADGAEFAIGQTVDVAVVGGCTRGVHRLELLADGGVVDTVNCPDPQPALSVTLRWAPDTPGAYALMVLAYDANGDSSDPASVMVKVVDRQAQASTAGSSSATAPVIQGFVASPLTIEAGASATLSWTVADATLVEIDQGVGAVDPSGSRSVSPASTTTYQLTAHGPGGDASATVQVTVRATAASTSAPAPTPTFTPAPTPTSTSAPTPTSKPAPTKSPPLPTPAPSPRIPAIDAAITFHSYDIPSGWVLFRIVNSGAAIQCVRARIVNRTTNAVYYGPAYSNEPFHPEPHVNPEQGLSSIAAGQTLYLRYRLSGIPTGVPCRATITLYTADDRGGNSAVKTVNFDLPERSIDATVTYHSYDASSGWVTFRIVNSASGARLESVQASIVNRNTNATYFAGSSNTPFFPSAASFLSESSLAPGDTRYLRYQLNSNPTGVPCRANLALYTADDEGGASKPFHVSFDLPDSGTINATITAHSYSSSTGWVTFRIQNTGSLTIESARCRIVNRNTNAVYYGGSSGYTSNTPFRDNPTTGPLVASCPAGATKYMRYRLVDKPTGVPCRATITLYSQDDSGGSSVVKTVDFTLASSGP